MRDHLLKIPIDTSSHDESNLYKNIKIRPNTTEQQRQTGRISSLMDKSGRWLPGRPLP